MELGHPGPSGVEPFPPPRDPPRHLAQRRLQTLGVVLRAVPPEPSLLFAHQLVRRAGGEEVLPPYKALRYGGRLRFRVGVGWNLEAGEAHRPTGEPARRGRTEAGGEDVAACLEDGGRVGRRRGRLGLIGPRHVDQGAIIFLTARANEECERATRERIGGCRPHQLPPDLAQIDLGQEEKGQLIGSAPRPRPGAQPGPATEPARGLVPP